MEPVTQFIDHAIEEEKPFLVWYAPFLPHTPHNPPARLLEKYSQEGRATDVAKYFAMCEWFDETCGDLLGHIEEKGITENTLVLYICDNGWAVKSTNAQDPNQKIWGSYALRSKGSPYDNGIRTPIMVSWPAKLEPHRSCDFAHAVDLFSTIVAAAGLPCPGLLPGVNLMDTKARSARKQVFGVTHSIHNMSPGDPDKTLQYLWCVESDWKLIQRFEGLDTTKYRNVHTWDKAPVRLYKIKEDPGETKDLAAEFPEVVERMKRDIANWQASLGNTQ